MIKFDFYWDPKKRKYGIYAISFSYEVPAEEYFKSRKSAKKRAKEMEKIAASVLRIMNKSKKDKK